MPTNNESLQEIIQKIPARHAGMDAMEVAATAISIWEQLAFKFIPLIGPGSVSLIYARSLELNKSIFPWLPASSSPDVAELPFAALKMTFECQQPAEIIAVNSALLDTFINLLATLIGVRLTIQFLRSAFPCDVPQENLQEN